MAQSLSKWIRGLREHLNLDQERFGGKFGVKQGTVSRWETGKSPPESDVRGQMYDLAKLSGYPADALAIAIGRPASAGSLMAPVVGYVGAGAEVIPFDDFAEGEGMEKIAAPVWAGVECEAVIIRGDSMYPLRDGWCIFYEKTGDGVPDGCAGQLCVCKTEDGRMLVKEVTITGERGVYNLVSWNAPTITDIRLEWATPVIDIRPQ